MNRRRWLAVLRRFRPSLGQVRTLLILAAVSATYAALLGWVLIQRYWTFRTFAWDLGIYNQAFFTTWNNHLLFYYTADLPNGGGGSLFAGHFAPFLFLLLPFYALYPNPEGLLIIESLALAVGVFPAYLLGRKLDLSPPWAGLGAGAYLLSPILMGIGWYDFHPEVLIPVTVVTTLYCFYARRRLAYWITWILALAVIETIVPFLLVFSVVVVLAEVYRHFRGGHADSWNLRMGLYGVATGAIWLILATAVSSSIGHTSAPGSLGSAYSSAWAVLGPHLSTLTVFPYALTHPSAAIAALTFQYPNKIAYAVVLLASFAFLPFLGDRRLLFPVAAWIGLVSLSNAQPFYVFGDQYAAYAFPFLAVGCITGIGKIRRWRNAWNKGPDVDSSTKPHRFRSFVRRAPRVVPLVTCLAVAGAVLATTATVSPLLPEPAWNYSSISHGIPTSSQHDATLHSILNLIPSGASVVTISAIFPEVSSRLHAFVVPISSYFRAGLTFPQALQGYVNESQFVLIDYVIDADGSSIIIRFANLSGFGIRAETSGIVLFQRGWSAAPSIWNPVNETIAGGSLVPVHAVVQSANSTQYGPILRTNPNPAVNSLLWTGPYIYWLPPGHYETVLRIGLEAGSRGAQLRIDVDSYHVNISAFTVNVSPSGYDYGFGFTTGDQSVLNSTTVSRSSPSAGFSDMNITLGFSWSSLQVLAIPGWAYSTSMQCQVYAVTIVQTSL